MGIVFPWTKVAAGRGGVDSSSAANLGFTSRRVWIQHLKMGFRITARIDAPRVNSKNMCLIDARSAPTRIVTVPCCIYWMNQGLQSNIKIHCITHTRDESHCHHSITTLLLSPQIRPRNGPKVEHFESLQAGRGIGHAHAKACRGLDLDYVMNSKDS